MQLRLLLCVACGIESYSLSKAHAFCNYGFCMCSQPRACFACLSGRDSVGWRVPMVKLVLNMALLCTLGLSQPRQWEHDYTGLRTTCSV